MGAIKLQTLNNSAPMETPINKIEINNSLAINENLLGKEKSSRCFNDGLYTADMIFHLRKTRENGKISVNVSKKDHLKYHL